MLKKWGDTMNINIKICKSFVEIGGIKVPIWLDEILQRVKIDMGLDNNSLDDIDDYQLQQLDEYTEQLAWTVWLEGVEKQMCNNGDE